MKQIDLRSDTVTLPTAEMREAMYKAEVGDDVYGEDPTVLNLEKLAAEITGKQASLFVPSGTMGNQLAAMSHTVHGEEIICEQESHVYYYEVGGLAVLSGLQTRTIVGDRGRLSPAIIEAGIRGKDIHQPQSSLIWLENTHNRAGGTFYRPDQLSAIRNTADDYSLKIHMDGARVFNAAVAQRISVKELVQHVDSVMFCLSKGLCAPVGSILAGSKEFIEKARRNRKMLGGGMRQAGILAAAGLVSLNKMVDRLAEDHDNAKRLAEGIADLGLEIDMETVQTNIVIFKVDKSKKSADKITSDLREAGILASQFGSEKIRMVTHYGITFNDINATLAALKKVIA